MEKFDILLLGDFAMDREVVGDNEKNLLGGAVYFGAFPLKKMGLKVGVITKLAKEDFPELSVFEKENIPVFASKASETTGMKNVYPTEKREERTCYPIGFAGSFTKNDLPAVESEIIHVGALLKGEVPVELLKYLSQESRLGIDLQGFVRRKKGDNVIMGEWSEADEALKYVTYLKADDTEAEVMTGTDNLKEAARELFDMGPDEVIITHDDGVLGYGGEQFREAPFKPSSLDGRTGRGDTCMSTYLGKRLQGSDIKGALKYAAALTTLKLDEPGPFTGKMEEVKKMLEKNQF